MPWTFSLHEIHYKLVWDWTRWHIQCLFKTSFTCSGIEGPENFRKKAILFFFLLSVRVTFRNVSNPHKKFWEVVTSLYDLKWENCHCCSSSTKSLEEYLMSMNSRKQKSADRLMCSLPSVQSRQEEIHVSGVFPHWYRLLIAALLCKHQIKTQFLPVKKWKHTQKKAPSVFMLLNFSSCLLKWIKEANRLFREALYYKTNFRHCVEWDMGNRIFI